MQLYETFTDCSTHLANLFVATAELNNKMALYMTDQKMFAVKIFYSSGGSCVAVDRQFQ
jgi:hypothetical protein